MSERTGMDRGTLAAVAAGATVGVVTFLIGYFATRRERRRMEREISVLRRDVSTMKTELSTIKTDKGKQCDMTDDGKVRNRRRRRVRSEMSGYDSESTMYTAQESDDEFYDLSDEDGLLQLSTEEDESQTFFKNIDTMMNSQTNVLETMLARAEDLGTNVNYLWRLAKAYKRQHDQCEGGKDEKLKLIEIGLNHARKAVDLDSTNGDAHKWVAILLGLKTDFLPVREKLENGMLFYKHVNKAVALKPSDHELYHLLARFKFEIASLTWFERSAAKMIGELPEVSLDDAIADANKCEELSTKPMPENRLLLAKAHFANNDSGMGLAWLRDAKEVCTDSGDVHNEVAQLIAKYQ